MSSATESLYASSDFVAIVENCAFICWVCDSEIARQDLSSSIFVFRAEICFECFDSRDSIIDSLSVVADLFAISSFSCSC